MWSRYHEEEDDPHSLYRLLHPHHHPRPHDGAVQYSDEESEEAHINIVGDDEDVDNGDVDDDEDQDEDDDEDEVIETKTPSRRLPSSSQSYQPVDAIRRSKMLPGDLA